MSNPTGKLQPGTGARMSSGANPSIAWWVRIVVLLGALLCAMGGVLALVNPSMLASPHDEINGAVRVYAGYLASRNLARAIMLFALLMLGARRALSQLMFLVALVQLLDVGMDCAEGRWRIVPGVVVLSVVFFLAAARLSRLPLWQAQAWQDGDSVEGG